MKDAAAGAALSYTFQDGEPKPTGEDGTLVAVYVDDYRYLTTGLRIATGVSHSEISGVAKVSSALPGHNRYKQIFRTPGSRRR